MQQTTFASVAGPMTRVACLMMQRDETLLLKPWLIYHGYLFGFENLYVFDNGSEEPSVLSALAEFEAVGVHIDRTHHTAGDFENKGVLVGERIGQFKLNNQYDVALPLDCDEFIAINGDRGIACNRTDIFAEMTAIHQRGVPCRTSHCLDNRPGHLDLFRYVGHIKSIVVVQEFLGIDHGFHQATLADGKTYGTTTLLHVHMHFKPFDHVLESSRNKLAPYVDVTNLDALGEFNGVGNHLKKYFQMTAEQFYTDLHGYTLPLIRFRGLTRVLAALTDLNALRLIWESGRSRDIGQVTFEVDLDRTPFSSTNYSEANPDLPKTEINLFEHYLRAGFFEGRRLEATKAGQDEVIVRLKNIRTHKRDGISGYAGVGLAYHAIDRCADAEAIVIEGIREFGSTPVLMREHALLALYQKNYPEAVIRWDNYRERFPTHAEGYQYGILANRLAGDFTNAHKVAQHGLDKFGAHLAIASEAGDLAVDQRDWLKAGKIWESLLQAHPDNTSIREKAAGTAFQLRLWQMENLGTEHVDIMDGPVIVSMSDAESQAALERLGFARLDQMRDFFMQFESLGYSCEFGLVQRRYGAEPISLLRWNSIHLPKLIDALNERFIGLDDPDNLVIVQAGRENVLRDLVYQTAMHTFTYVDEVDPARLKNQQIKRTSFLRRKLLTDLESPEKIFVHLDDEPNRSPSEINQLATAFNAYGQGQLLYVQISGARGKHGTVERADTGLLLGYIERLGRGEDGSWRIDFDSWLSLCIAAKDHFAPP